MTGISSSCSSSLSCNGFFFYPAGPDIVPPMNATGAFHFGSGLRNRWRCRRRRWRRGEKKREEEEGKEEDDDDDDVEEGLSRHVPVPRRVLHRRWKCLATFCEPQDGTAVSFLFCWTEWWDPLFFYRVFTEFYRVVAGRTNVCPSITEFYLVLPSFTKFDQVLPSFP